MAEKQLFELPQLLTLAGEEISEESIANKILEKSPGNACSAGTGSGNHSCTAGTD